MYCNASVGEIQQFQSFYSTKVFATGIITKVFTQTRVNSEFQHIRCKHKESRKKYDNLLFYSYIYLMFLTPNLEERTHLEIRYISPPNILQWRTIKQILGPISELTNYCWAVMARIVALIFHNHNLWTLSA